MIKKLLNDSFIRIFGYKINIQKVSQSDQQTDYKRLRAVYKDVKSLKLHFGCGPRVLKDWVNIDILFEPYEKYMRYYGDRYYSKEVRGSREDFFEFNVIDLGMPLPDDSVDIVFHEDFIEHLSQKNQIIFLSETYRVMKKGALHRINTPDLTHSMRINSKFYKGREGVFVREWDDNSHVNLFTKEYLKEIATLIGYSKIIFNSKNSSISKGIPLEYRPSEDRDQVEGNIFADLIK